MPLNGKGEVCELLPVWAIGRLDRILADPDRGSPQDAYCPQFAENFAGKLRPYLLAPPVDEDRVAVG
jgi:hypothetical protein